MDAKISCIIPAYNEERRIGGVLRAVVGHPLVDEVIVVDDGSQDGTKDAIAGFEGVRLITYGKNRGKTSALLRGIRAANNDLLMLLDADLSGLSAQDVTRLASPVIDGSADVSISIRKNSLWMFRMLGMDFVSGERIFARSLLGDIERFSSLTGFGFESFLNNEIIDGRRRIKTVWLRDVSHARKSDKQGFMKGSLSDLSMVGDILKTIGPTGVIRQIQKMRSLRV